MRMHLDVDFCTGKYNGLYLVVSNCSAYYVCLYEETSVELCPGDFIFSDVRKQCVPLARASPQRRVECTRTTRYLPAA